MKKLLIVSILLTVISTQAQWTYNANGWGGVQTTGNTNRAYGLIAIAMGDNTTAEGYVSTAMGYYTLAEGGFSTAMGYETHTKAGAAASTAMGYKTYASGTSSTAMGSETIASGYASTAMGDKTYAIGESSTAMGYETYANGLASTAMGTYTKTEAENSTAMGYFTKALGINSTAMGDNSTARGENSTAMGFHTWAKGNKSTSMGSYSWAIGENSTAMGDDTKAEGENSTTMGFRTRADGKNSTAMGLGTTAGDFGTLAIGYLNTTDPTPNPDSFNLENRALVIGNGIDDANRSDALTVLFDGTTTIAGSVTAPFFEGDGSLLTNLPNQNTDDQTLALNVNSLELEDGGNVDLSGYLDNTDAQNINGSGLSGTTLTIGIEGGTSEDIDLSSLDNSGTDDQVISLTGNNLELEDGGIVDLSGYLDNTDDQNISGSGFAANMLTIGIEGGTSEDIDLSSLDNSGTDNQQITTFEFVTSSNLKIEIENGNVMTADLSPLLSDLEAENEELLSMVTLLQTQMEDLIARMEIREECECTPLLDVGDFNLTRNQAYLSQNVPNPFDNTTSVGYFIPLSYSKANIIVSTTTGQILKNINITKFGEGAIDINKERMATAIYYYTLYVDGKKVDTKRMIVE